MNTVIKIQSKADAKAGKALVVNPKKKEVHQLEFHTVGILEGGMESGETSLMFIMEDDDNIIISEVSARHFKMMQEALRGAEARWEVENQARG